MEILLTIAPVGQCLARIDGTLLPVRIWNVLDPW